MVNDAYGTLLQDGDMVTMIKDLKVKGSSSVAKVGTKVKINRLGRATIISTARLRVSER